MSFQFNISIFRIIKSSLNDRQMCIVFVKIKPKITANCALMLCTNNASFLISTTIYHELVSNGTRRSSIPVSIQGQTSRSTGVGRKVKTSSDGGKLSCK